MKKHTPDATTSTKSAQPKVIKIPVAKIRTNGGTQIRAELNAERVEDYGAKYEAGVTLPPPVVFFDGDAYWLADGFHRVAAHRAHNLATIAVEVRSGTRRDAVLHAVGANEEHGLPRTNADKRRAVEVMLRDEEWSTWSDRKIAGACRVHHELVGRLRQDLTGGSASEARRYVTKHGSEAVMNTRAIGKAAKAAKAPARVVELVPPPKPEPAPLFAPKAATAAPVVAAPTKAKPTEPVWDPDDFLSRIGDQIHEWRTTWRTHEPTNERLAKYIRLGLSLLEKEDAHDANR